VAHGEQLHRQRTGAGHLIEPGEARDIAASRPNNRPAAAA